MELDDLKTRAEMAESELQLLKTELEEKGPQSVGADFMNKQQEQQILKLKDAVVKLRDINATDRQLFLANKLHCRSLACCEFLLVIDFSYVGNISCLTGVKDVRSWNFCVSLNIVERLSVDMDMIELKNKTITIMVNSNCWLKKNNLFYFVDKDLLHFDHMICMQYL